MIYLQERNQNHVYFQVRYVHLDISEENTSHVLNTFQRSREAAAQQKHIEKNLKLQEFKDNVLHNVNKIIQRSCCQGTSKHKSDSYSKNLITTVIALCCSIIRKISL